jgi:hypothetical protein
MGGAEKVLNYLIDNSHRWAGADPERGPTHRATGYRKNELYRGVKKDGQQARKKVDNNKSEGLFARDSKI